MHENITIREKDILELMGQAFDEGHSGYKDLKESTIRKLLDNYIKNNPSDMQIPIIFPNIPNIPNIFSPYSTPMTLTGLSTPMTLINNTNSTSSIPINILDDLSDDSFQ
jgi:hypothetical protein